MECNHAECNESIANMVGSPGAHIEAHSVVAVLQKVDTAGYTFCQCDQGPEHNFVSYQHYHCSHSHMQQGMISCINEHYSEESLHGIPVGGGSTILHRIVLGSNVECSTCNKLLDGVGYRFCLTAATPYNYLPDGLHTELSSWCCSLEHAKQHAIAVINSMDLEIVVN